MALVGSLVVLVVAPLASAASLHRLWWASVRLVMVVRRRRGSLALTAFATSGARKGPCRVGMLHRLLQRRAPCFAVEVTRTQALRTLCTQSWGTRGDSVLCAVVRVLWEVCVRPSSPGLYITRGRRTAGARHDSTTLKRPRRVDWNLNGFHRRASLRTGGRRASVHCRAHARGLVQMKVQVNFRAPPMGDALSRRRPPSHGVRSLAGCPARPEKDRALLC
jgi:hypothetical protein